MPEQVTVHAANHRDECFVCYGPIARRCAACGQGYCERLIGWLTICSVCKSPLDA